MTSGQSEAMHEAGAGMYETAQPPLEMADAAPTAYQVTVPEQGSGLLSSWQSRLAAGVAAAGVILAPTAANHAVPVNAVVASQSYGTENGAVVDPVPANITQDFSRALQADTCETRVSLTDVTDIYQRLWLTHEGKDWTTDQYKDYTDALLSELDFDRQELGIGLLPATFFRLEEDANGTQQLPLSEYEDAAQHFFAEKGIAVLFDWDTEQAAKNPHLQGAFNDMYPFQPSPTAPESYARQNILALMVDLASLPPAALDDPKVDTIVAGRFKPETNAAGMYFTTQGTIGVDIGTDPYYFRRITPHETTHNMSYGLCKAIFSGNAAGQGSDPAIAVLNQGFLYPPSKGGPVTAGSSTQERFTDLQDRYTAAGKIVSESGYGMTSTGEDIAEDIGAGILDAPNAFSLYDATAQYMDETPLREKITLELTRLAQAHPRDANYIVHVMQLSQLYEGVENRQLQFGKALSEYRALNPYTNYTNTLTPSAIDRAAKDWSDQRGVLLSYMGQIDTAIDLSVAMQQRAQPFPEWTQGK